MSDNGKAKFAMYWAASCGGCEIAVLNIGEKILDVDAAFDVVFWPVAMDARYRDVEALADGEIDATLINGAIRLDEHVHTVRLLRRKSKCVIAHGACAQLGGVIGLANLFPSPVLLERAYRQVPSMANPAGLMKFTRPSSATPKMPSSADSSSKRLRSSACSRRA